MKPQNSFLFNQCPKTSYPLVRPLISRARLYSAIGLLLGIALLVAHFQTHQAVAAEETLPPLIFVARSHLATPDTIFRDEVGPAGQFGTGIAKFAPGSKLVRRNPDGSLFVYSTPGLVDLQSPDVSFDGTSIVFAGATTVRAQTEQSGWRLYAINVDGSNFRQLTFADRAITIPHAARFFNQRLYESYDDLFPAYLADGRIVFVSTRYPARAHYDERRVTNLYLINGDGSNLHRITSERGGILHPTPLPDGRILATRWWLNFNQPTETGIYNRIDNRSQEQQLPDGTVIHANANEQFNPATGTLADGFAIRDAPNSWHLMTLNPDGTEFQRFAWTPYSRYTLDRDTGFYDTYHATQPAIVQRGDELLVAYTSQQDSTMFHTTLKTGIRVARPGIEMMYANTTDAIAGLTYTKAWEDNDESPPYALHPWGLPNGRLLYSQSVPDATLPRTGTYTEGEEEFALQGSNLRYRLYLMDLTESLGGANQREVSVDLGAIGLSTADIMDAKPIVARVGWQARSDRYRTVASDDPTTGNLPNTLPAYRFSLHGPTEIATATVHNSNVYANPDLLLPYVNNSPPPGSVATVEVWVDANQFTGAYCYADYPEPCADFQNDSQVRAVLWNKAAVSAAGAFTMTIPADTPSFFILRAADGRIVRNWQRGYMAIAQGNAWARPGEEVTCTGCHMGHVSGSMASASDSDAGWTNIAPHATVSASSFFAHNDSAAPDYKPFRPHFLNDRRGWVPTPTDGPTAPFLQPQAELRRYRALLARLGLPLAEASTVVPASVKPDSAQRPASRGTIPPVAQVAYQDDQSSWLSAQGSAAGEWITLRWTSPVRVRAVRLVGVPPLGGDWDGFGQPPDQGPYYVEQGTLRLYHSGAQQGAAIAIERVEPMATGGTLITLPTPLEIDALRVEIDAISGRWWSEEIAALSEIEVIGMDAAAMPMPDLDLPEQIYLPAVAR